MSLQKWGEIVIERGNIGTLIGVVCGVLAGIIYTECEEPVIIIFAGIACAILGHFFDPTKTVIYEEVDKKSRTSTSKISGVVPNGRTYCSECQKSDAYIDANGDLYCPNCKKII